MNKHLSSNHLSILFFIAFLFTVCAMFSCRKTSKADKPNYQISYTGELRVGGMLYFQSTAPVTSVFDWDFGDNSVSNQANPYHAFLKAGRYNVSVTVNHDTSTRFGITIEIPFVPAPGTSFTHLMGGLRYWHCLDTFDYWSASKFYNDTFALDVLDDTSISLSPNGLVFKFKRFSSGDSSLLFEWHNGYTYSVSQVFYFIKYDSVFVRIDYSNHGGWGKEERSSYKP